MSYDESTHRQFFDFAHDIHENTHANLPGLETTLCSVVNGGGNGNEG